MKIELMNIGADQWAFQVVAGNGKPLCASSPYRSRRNARDAARLLVDQVGNAVIVAAA